MAPMLCLGQAPAWGWLNARTAGALAAASVLLGLFARHEQRARRSLKTLSIFPIRNLSRTSMMMAAVYTGNLGMFFLLTLYLQLAE